MDNPEEVLQALDEFQKMRPSEIPKELEDYLCWVAKTGDPVYQWSLIKVLFREKLLRVMTDFYESCPTLDLAPCPNVEPFNYDIMKSSLLKRLDNFPSAPFTVQRICELLTTPRKEYNRIDKFMRAVEKNILVVSTKEPGSFGRRSENGDSLVNGSIDDETSHHGQSSNEIEMENWVKDFTTPAVAIPVHAGDSEEMSVDPGLNLPIKNNSFEKQDRIEPLSAVDATASSFVTSTSDFQVATTMPPQLPATEPSTTVQNLTASNQETTAAATDVSDAIMNEDTSSQPSLELESDDSDSNEAKKLQTTFQAKDFKSDETESPKVYSEEQDSKAEENIENRESNKQCDQLIQSTYSSQKLDDECSNEVINSEKVDLLSADSVTNETTEIFESDKKVQAEPQISEKSSETESNECLDDFQTVNSNLDSKTDDIEVNVDSSTILLGEKDDVEKKEEVRIEPIAQENILETTDSVENYIKESSDEVETTSEIHKPIIEEPLIETTDSNSSTKAESTELTIEETVEDNVKTKTIVPDPIPIVEEPKDVESPVSNWDSTALITEESKKPISVTSDVSNDMEESKSNQEEENQMVISGCDEATSNKDAMESMDVDNEGLVTSAQLDEPMEEETTEAMNS